MIRKILEYIKKIIYNLIEYNKNFIMFYSNLNIYINMYKHIIRYKYEYYSNELKYYIINLYYSFIYWVFNYLFKQDNLYYIKLILILYVKKNRTIRFILSVISIIIKKIETIHNILKKILLIILFILDFFL